MIKYRSLFKCSIRKFLLKKGYSESNIFNLIKNNCIRINGNIVRDKNDTVPVFSSVSVKPADEECRVIKTEKSLDIRYEDEYLLIVYKPAGINTEPSRKDNENTLSNHVAFYYYIQGIKSNIHPVNRLDRDTSGLVIFAKNGFIHNLMGKTKIKKKYKALVSGHVNNGTIRVKIKKGPDGIKRIVSPDGKECITVYRKVRYDGNNTLVKIRLLTGRTHQIRVSFAYAGHPLTGDKLYNENDSGIFYLESCKVTFRHPITKKYIMVSTE